MCDYSLAVLPNRLAVAGEELVVHRFRTGSLGLASAAEIRGAQCPDQRKTLWQRVRNFFEEPLDSSRVAAVCVPPGAQLLLKNLPADWQRQWRHGDEESVFFVQISALENSYRDAVRFHDGRQVLLQHLREGTLVQVLSLGEIEMSEEHELAFRHS